MKLLRLIFAFAISAGSAHASLIASGYLTVGTGPLVTDTTTGLVWLATTYTAGHTYDDSFVQSIISGYGYHYASEAQVESMINLNFNNPPTSAPGTPAGFADAQAFFDVFGINQFISCSGGACPRTQGLTSTSTSAGFHDAVGMIQVGANGWMIDANPWPDYLPDTQMGSWLVSSTPVAVTPEPSSLLLIGTGIASLAAMARRRRSSNLSR